jgi:tetratricopeptide (TPR) repeat protein
VKIKSQIAVLFLFVLTVSGCLGMAASPEEYYSIGMSYFELGKYEEAEIWLNRARTADRTMVASQYNLGRLAYERKRYDEAAKLFEDILKKDPDNVLALKAAAYTRIHTGDISIAEKHYARLLELVPESADDGYNHALVLYAMERYSDAEKTLERYLIPLLENSDIQLLYARSQSAQNKAEAIDSYAKWLLNNTDAKVRSEYAQVLEHHELYARALEEYRKALTEVPDSNKTLKGEIHFALARLLLIADSASNAGITELQNAVNEGFNDIAAVEELLNRQNISAANRDSIRNIINNIRRTTETSNEQKTQEEDSQTNDDNSN